MLHGLHVDLVVFLMRADKLDEKRSSLVQNGNHDAVIIALDVEHYAVVAGKACVAILGLDVNARGAAPLPKCSTPSSRQRRFHFAPGQVQEFLRLHFIEA